MILVSAVILSSFYSSELGYHYFSNNLLNHQELLNYIHQYPNIVTVEKYNEQIGKIVYTNKECLVAIPYTMEQGEHEGNIYETHHQPDLTNEIFLERYPCMKLLYKDDGYGYYINY
jgi:hypothetical protein